MSHLELRLLGTFQASLDGLPVSPFESGKVRELLAYLAVESDSPHTRDELAAEFARLRAIQLEALKTVTTSDLARTARHSELGLVTLGELIHEWVGHDLMHTVQAERALLQLFIAGCGPWRPYFADHDKGHDLV